MLKIIVLIIFFIGGPALADSTSAHCRIGNHTYSSPPTCVCKDPYMFIDAGMGKVSCVAKAAKKIHKAVRKTGGNRIQAYCRYDGLIKTKVNADGSFLMPGCRCEGDFVNVAGGVSCVRGN